MSQILSEAQLDTLAEKNWLAVDDFISAKQVELILEDIAFWQNEDAFKQAGVGKLNTHQIDASYRKDKIKWIDPEKCRPATNDFVNAISELMHQLNRAYYISLKDFECHYALYEPGDFYKRHSDQFNQKAHRIISMVLYLNTGWKKGDGGELVIYNEHENITIEPLAGRLMLFKSETEHEVLPTIKERYSITGWLKDQYNDVNFL
jgi:SM-20-related protein